MSWLTGFETHRATFTGERQVGETELNDGFGSGETVPDLEDVVVLGDVWIRYEPNGAGLARDFQGERSEDEPVVFVDGHDAVDEGGSIILREGDHVEIEGIEGTFECQNLEPHTLDGPELDFILLNPVRIDG